MELKEVISGVKRKHPQSEKTLYTLLYERHFKIPMAYCTDREESMSVFNHAVLSIFSTLKEFDTLADLLRWSARIIRNDCIDHVRKKTVYRNKLHVVEQKVAEAHIENEALSHLYFEDFLSILQHLDTKHRLCLVMHTLDGYTHKEIAKKLNINANTSKWYVAEAKKQLKKVLLTQKMELAHGK